MNRAAVIACLSLSACASVGDLYGSGVDETFTSTKPIATVSSCLQVKYATAPITTPGGETTFIMKNAQQAPLALLTLTVVPEGTRIDMRRANAINILGNWRSCG